jgi:hypothetical protein
MTIMKRPISLTIAAVIVFLIGLSVMVAECWRTRSLALVPGWSLFTMIAGVGLLKFSRMARWYVLFVFGTLFLFMLPFTIWTIFNPSRIVLNFPAISIDDRPHAVESWFVIIPVMLGYLAISGFVLYVLLRQRIYELFQRKTDSPVIIPV